MSDTIKLPVAGIAMDKTLHMFVREQTNPQQWRDFTDTLEACLLRRMAATPDQDLPRLKGKVEYIGELRNLFQEIFQNKS